MRAPFLILFCTFFLQAQEQPLPGPQIQFEALSHQYGTVKQFTEVSYAFPFTNTGTETLLIEKIEAG